MKEQMGDYRIIRQMGEGALGSLFLAEHRFLKKNFCLKILPDELAVDQGFTDRLIEELPLLSGLDHPHIVKMYTASEIDGQFFLVTDAIVDAQGYSLDLASYIASQGGRLLEQEIVKIAHQLASALDYAHEHGVAHLGIKPTNIQVRKGKEGLEVFLSDFGLTRIVGTRRILSKILAQSVTSYLDNYLYLAPEQKSPEKAALVGTSSDLYAFGVLLYYLLMGVYPEGVFPLPSHLKGKYKLSWDHLVVACLQLDPEKRPVKLVDLLEKLLLPAASLSRELYRWTPEEQAGAPSGSAAETFSEGAVALAELPKLMLRPREIQRPEYDADPASVFHIDTSVARYHHQKKAPTDIEPMLTEMVVIDGGVFTRGSNHGARDEAPQHKVTLSSFAIDVNPVTNEQFMRFLDAMGGEKDANNLDIIRLRDSRIKRLGGKLSVESGYAKHPIVGVTWYGAVAYAKWVGKRLPTEAEWEVACAGGLEDTLYPTGKNIERSQANFFSSDTTPVMSYPPNGYGLYDMVGNVYEWCQDWYEFNYYNTSLQEPNNPQGPVQGVYRVVRGGCWKSLKEDLRVSHRHRNNPGTINRTYGFRCACDVN